MVNKSHLPRHSRYQSNKKILIDFNRFLIHGRLNHRTLSILYFTTQNKKRDRQSYNICDN